MTPAEIDNLTRAVAARITADMQVDTYADGEIDIVDGSLHRIVGRGYSHLQVGEEAPAPYSRFGLT